MRKYVEKLNFLHTSHVYNDFLEIILRHYIDVVSLGKALHPQMLHLTQMKKISGMT